VVRRSVRLPKWQLRIVPARPVPISSTAATAKKEEEWAANSATSGTVLALCAKAKVGNVVGEALMNIR